MAIAVDDPRRDRGAVREMLIDVDVHESPSTGQELMAYLPEHFYPVLFAALPWSAYANPLPHGGLRADWVDPDGRGGVDRELMARHLFDGEGVTTAVLGGGWVMPMDCSVTASKALNTAYNQWQVEHWLEFDPRFHGSIHVPIDDPAAAAEEIDRAAAHPRMVQVLLPAVNHHQYGDPMFRPLFEAAVRNGLPVAIHHGGHTKTAIGWPRNFVEWDAVAAPQAGMSQVMSIILNGTFDRLPDLKVVLLETGVTWLPWFIGRLDATYLTAKHEVPWVKRLPSQHMRDNVRVAAQPLDDCSPARLEEIVHELDAEEMLLFATDYPHHGSESADGALPRALGALGERVRWRNAIDTYPRLNANGGAA